MPVTTGRRQGRQVRANFANNGRVWSNEADAADAGMDETTFAQISPDPVVNVQGQDLGYLRIGDFGVLSEDGGTLPAGATITKVTFSARINLVNGTATLGSGSTLKMIIVARNGVNAYGAVSAGLDPTNNNSGATTATTTITATTGGTLTAPQTIYARSDFSNALDGADEGAQLATYAQYRTKEAAGGTPFGRLFWVAVEVEWAQIFSRVGGGASAPVAGTAKSVLTARKGGGLSVPIGSGKCSTVAQRSGGGTSAPIGSGKTSPAVNRAGGGTSGPAGGGRRTQEAIQRGGGTSSPVAGGRFTTLSIRRGGGASNPAGSGGRTVLVARSAGGTFTSVGGGKWSAAVSRVGGSVSSPAGGGIKTALVHRLGGGNAVPAGGGVERLYAFGLSGITRDATGRALGTCRVDVFRTDTKGFLVSVTSNAAGFYQVALTSDPITYFLRSYKAGTPNLFATTDENLIVDQTVVQGPPE